MDTVITAVRFLAVSQLVFFLSAIVISNNPPRVKWSGIWLLFGSLAYLLAPIVLTGFGIVPAAILWTFASLVPSAIVLFTWVVFEERRTLPKWMLLLLCGDVVIETLCHISFVQMGGHPQTIVVSLVLKRMLLLTIAVFLLWRGKECDLVETRAKLRWWVIGSISVLVFVIDFSHIFTSYQVPPEVELPSLSAVFLVTLAINLLFLKFNAALVLVGERSTIKLDTNDSETRELLSRMADERLYADHDLRIGTLAQKLGLPEYQLRKKINQNLGYRNFNQFVNSYRIEEAGTQLQKDLRTPVLTIALAAFQSHFGVSPTAYRKQSV